MGRSITFKDENVSNLKCSSLNMMITKQIVFPIIIKLSSQSITIRHIRRWAFFSFN